jgi:hypothetical protein
VLFISSSIYKDIFAMEIMENVRADLHNHLRMDKLRGRKNNTFNEVIDAAAKKLECGGVFALANYGDKRFEDFSELLGYDRIQFNNALYVPEKEIWVVKGEEIETKQGHMLALGVDKYKKIAFGRNIKDTIKEAKDLGALIGVDHPFYLEGAGEFLIDSHQNYFGDIHFWEVHNGEAALWIPGMTKRKANDRANDIFNELKGDYQNLAKSVASDGHSIYELGSSYMEIPKISGTNRKEIVDSLYNSMLAATNQNMPDKRTNNYIGAINHCAHMILPILKGNAKLKSSK